MNFRLAFDIKNDVIIRKRKAFNGGLGIYLVFIFVQNHAKEPLSINAFLKII